MDSINPNFIKKSKYQKTINENIVQCLTCERYCKISKGNFGFCGTRLNDNGILNTIVYGCIPSLSYNPIEKKPLFHFYPGSIALTVGTYGCNFSCFWCQNYRISHPKKPILEKIKNEKYFLSPEKFIEIAINNNCQGTSISFNEPTLLFEYSLDIFKLAKQNGLYNTYVSNGFMTENVLRDLVKAGLDAINIDIKGSDEMVSKYCGADIEIVWRNAKLAKDLGLHVEITTLLIEKLNSEEKTVKEIAQRILNELGAFTPFHITRFFPQYKSNEHGYFKPTSEKLLYNAHETAKKVGLKYVYLGNILNKEYESTICPKCSKIVIERSGFGIQKILLNSMGNCSFCGFKISKM